MGDDKTGLAFEIESYEIENHIQTSRIIWSEESITKKADELLAEQYNTLESSAREETIKFDLLKGKLKPESKAEIGENVLRALENGLLTPSQAQSILDIIKTFASLVSDNDSKAQSLLELFQESLSKKTI